MLLLMIPPRSSARRQSSQTITAAARCPFRAAIPKDMPRPGAKACRGGSRAKQRSPQKPHGLSTTRGSCLGRQAAEMALKRSFRRPSGSGGAGQGCSFRCLAEGLEQTRGSFAEGIGAAAGSRAGTGAAPCSLPTLMGPPAQRDQGHRLGHQRYRATGEAALLRAQRKSSCKLLVASQPAERAGFNQEKKKKRKPNKKLLTKHCSLSSTCMSVYYRRANGLICTRPNSIRLCLGCQSPH